MIWVKLNGCSETPTTETISEDGDEISATRKAYGGGKDGARSFWSCSKKEVTLGPVRNHQWV